MMSEDDDDVVCLTPFPAASATGSSVSDGESATPPSGGSTKTTQTLVLRPLGSGRVFTATTSPSSEATESGPVFTATFNQTEAASASTSSALEGFGRLAAAPVTSTNSSSHNGNLSPSKKTSLENGTSSTSSTTTPSHPMLKLTTEEFMKRLNETSQPLAPLQPNHRPPKTYASTVLPLPPPSSFEPSHHPSSPVYTSYRPPRPSQPPPVTPPTVYYPHLPPQDDDNGPKSTPSLSAEDRARREAFLTRKFRNQKLMERYSCEQKDNSEALTNAVPQSEEVNPSVSSATPSPAPSTSHVIRGGYQPFLNAANEVSNPPDAFEFESLQDVSRARQQQWTDHRQQHELRRMNQAILAKHNKQLQLQRNIVSKVLSKEPSKQHTLVLPNVASENTSSIMGTSPLVDYGKPPEHWQPPLPPVSPSQDSTVLKWQKEPSFSKGSPSSVPTSITPSTSRPRPFHPMNRQQSRTPRDYNERPRFYPPRTAPPLQISSHLSRHIKPQNKAQRVSQEEVITWTLENSRLKIRHKKSLMERLARAASGLPVEELCLEHIRHLVNFTSKRPFPPPGRAVETLAWNRKRMSSENSMTSVSSKKSEDEPVLVKRRRKIAQELEGTRRSTRNNPLPLKKVDLSPPKATSSKAPSPTPKVVKPSSTASSTSADVTSAAENFFGPKSTSKVSPPKTTPSKTTLFKTSPLNTSLSNTSPPKTTFPKTTLPKTTLPKNKVISSSSSVDEPEIELPRKSPNNKKDVITSVDDIYFPPRIVFLRETSALETFFDDILKRVSPERAAKIDAVRKRKQEKANMNSPPVRNMSKYARKMTIPPGFAHSFELTSKAMVPVLEEVEDVTKPEEVTGAPKKKVWYLWVHKKYEVLFEANLEETLEVIKEHYPRFEPYMIPDPRRETIWAEKRREMMAANLLNFQTENADYENDEDEDEEEEDDEVEGEEGEDDEEGDEDEDTDDDDSDDDEEDEDTSSTEADESVDKPEVVIKEEDESNFSGNTNNVGGDKTLKIPVVRVKSEDESTTSLIRISTFPSGTLPIVTGNFSGSTSVSKKTSGSEPKDMLSSFDSLSGSVSIADCPPASTLEEDLSFLNPMDVF